MPDVERPDEDRRLGPRPPPAGALPRVRLSARDVGLAAAIVVPVVGLLGALYLLVGGRVVLAVVAGLVAGLGAYLGATRAGARGPNLDRQAPPGSDADDRSP
jgi:hypothetical protein